MVINPAHPCMVISMPSVGVLAVAVWTQSHQVFKGSERVFYYLLMHSVEVTAAEAVTVLLEQG